MFGILKSSTWAWIRPIDAPTISGHEITPLGFSLVPFLIVGGFVVLGCFLAWEERRERLGKSTLLDRALVKIETLRAGLSSLCAQQLIVMGTFFVLPVYLQVVLGFDAFETGKRLFPMSISMLAAALIGPKVAVRFGPRTVVQVGLGAMAIAALVLVGTIDVTLNGTAFAVSLVFFGIGAGLLMSQLGNVIMSSAPPEETNEAGGLQGTAQNLGASLGTALIGSVLLLGLLNGFNTRIEENPAVPADVKTQIAAATEQGIPIVTTEQAHEALLDAGLTPAEADAVTADYSDAQLDALKTSMLAVAFLAVISFWFTRRLPARSVARGSTAKRGPTPCVGNLDTDSGGSVALRTLSEGSIVTNQEAPSAASGQLLLADISGYTSFLQTVALAHKDDAFADGAVPPPTRFFRTCSTGSSDAWYRRSHCPSSRGTRSSHMHPIRTRYHAERPCLTA